MKLLLLNLLLLLSVPTFAAESHIEKMIRATPGEEAGIADAYDIYISAISNKSIPKARVCFPMSLVKESSSHFILERGYYVSPNEFRGFGLAIPKSLAKKEHGQLKATRDLKLQSEERRQNLHTIVFTETEIQPATALNHATATHGTTHGTVKGGNH